MMRGQLQHPLNWILVLFAGVFFLLMFVVIIRSVLDTHGGVGAFEQLKQLETMIDASQANPDANNTYELEGVVTRCGPETAGIFTADVAGQLLQFPGQAIFTPGDLDGGLSLWTQEFSLGMPIATITNIIPADTLFVVISGTPGVDGLLRGNANVRTVTVSELSEERFSGFREIVVVNAGQQTGFNLQGKHLHLGGRQQAYGVNIDYGANPLDSGTLTYYHYADGFVQEGSGLDYLSGELLAAGIFAGSADRFSCGRAVLEARIRFLARLNRLRLQKILLSNPPALCGQHYRSAVDVLADLETATFQNNIQPLKDRKATLYRLNIALGNEECPMIY